MQDEEYEYASLSDESEEEENHTGSEIPEIKITPVQEEDPKPVDILNSPVEFMCEKELEELDEISDEDLINLIQEKELEHRHLSLENRIFLRYLQANDPVEVESFNKKINSAIDRVWEKYRENYLQEQYAIRHKSKSVHKAPRKKKLTYITSLFEYRGPKINISHKSDMALKAIEELQVSLQGFIRKNHKIRRTLKSELEEFSIRENEIRKLIDSFGYDFLVRSVDPLTQRIPAEKFVRWIEEWMKSAQLTIEKLRLRMGPTKHNLQLVSATLVKRKELRRNVHATDFDRLEIENKNLLRKLEDVQIHLTEMKITQSTANIALNNMKYELRRQRKEYDDMRIVIEGKVKNIRAIEEQCIQVEPTLVEAQDDYFRFKELTESYKVPDVMEYFKIKCDLRQLEHQKKMWQRRKKIQDITINASLRQLKDMRGISKIDRAWLNSFFTDNVDMEYSLTSSEEKEEKDVLGEEYESTSTTESSY